MDIAAIIKSRRSVRSYKLKKVPKKLLGKILDSARWAPSFHNLQPWNFIIPEGLMRKRLIDIMKEHKRSEPITIRLFLKHAVGIIEKAPLIILVYDNKFLSNKIKKGDRFYLNCVSKFEIQSVSCAIQNMLLTAHSFGLGATWFGIPLFREKQINKLFGAKGSLMAIVTIGYPDKKTKAPRRRPMSEIISFVK